MPLPCLLAETPYARQVRPRSAVGALPSLDAWRQARSEAQLSSVCGGEGEAEDGEERHSEETRRVRHYFHILVVTDLVISMDFG